MIEPRSFGAPWLCGLRLALFVIMSSMLALAPATAAYAGTVIEIAGIHSAALPPQGARVWLPDGYGQGTRRYGVVYVHDGQAAFRAGAADEQNFAIDRTVAELVAWPAYFARLGPPAGRKLWLDHRKTMIDAGYGPYQAAIPKRLEAQGWKRGVNLETRAYEGGAHTWTDWSRNMPQILAWLLA